MPVVRILWHISVQVLFSFYERSRYVVGARSISLIIWEPVVAEPIVLRIVDVRCQISHHPPEKIGEDIAVSHQIAEGFVPFWDVILEHRVVHNHLPIWVNRRSNAFFAHFIIPFFKQDQHVLKIKSLISTKFMLNLRHKLKNKRFKFSSVNIVDVLLKVLHILEWKFLAAFNLTPENLINSLGPRCRHLRCTSVCARVIWRLPVVCRHDISSCGVNRSWIGW